MKKVEDNRNAEGIAECGTCGGQFEPGDWLTISRDGLLQCRSCSAEDARWARTEGPYAVVQEYGARSGQKPVSRSSSSYESEGDVVRDLLHWMEEVRRLRSHDEWRQEGEKFRFTASANALARGEEE